MAVQTTGPGHNPDQLLAALWRSPDLCHQVGVLDRPSGHFSNHPVSNIGDAIDKTAASSAAGNDAYVACAEYATPDNRTAANASGAWAFWLDIDVGDRKAAEGRGYATIKEAQQAVEKFCIEADLPHPTHQVGSGSGLHVYFVCDGLISREVWLTSARKMKALTHALDLHADDTRTADLASVLRMPGTLNYKYNPPALVALLHSDDQYISQDAMLEAIDRAFDSFCAPRTTAGATSRAEGYNSSTRGNTNPSGYGAPDLAKLASALTTLEPDCDDHEWKFARIAPLARAANAHPEMAADLKKLGQAWSSGELRGKASKAWVTPGNTNGLTGESVFESVWQRFLNEPPTDGHTSLGTIFHDAEQAGWLDPARENFDTCDYEIIQGKPEAASDKPSGPITLEEALEVAKALVAEVGIDVGAPFERDALAALRIIHQASLADYVRTRAALKQANKAVSVVALDHAVMGEPADPHLAQTHHGYAQDILAELKVDGWPPVGYEGVLWVVNASTAIWERYEQERVERLVAERHDGKDFCSRRSDYTSIALHTLSLATNPAFFAEAPIGVACPGGFLQVVGDAIELVKLTPDHRQRVMLPFTPADLPTPLFEKFMKETFETARAGETEQQIGLLQEITGTTMAGIMHRYQKAAQLYEPFGRAGKGTFMQIATGLVPPNFVKAVSPFKWDDEYYLAMLAGARLNVVGELDEAKAIPAATFKTVLGGDLLTGRHPAGRPISFKNHAAHIFMSNHPITTKDQSEAFFSRWLLVEFPNSRSRLGLSIDPTLADRIIASEMPGIAFWAMQGAVRLLRNGKFSNSSAHDRLMAQWRKSTNSLEEFIGDVCAVAPDVREKRSVFYQCYTHWCKDNGRKPFAKGRVKDLLERNVGLGVSLAEINGYETLKGVQVDADFKASVFQL